MYAVVKSRERTTDERAVGPRKMNFKQNIWKHGKLGALSTSRLSRLNSTVIPCEIIILCLVTWAVCINYVPRWAVLLNET
jgi:hypothetical protein